MRVSKPFLRSGENFFRAKRNWWTELWECGLMYSRKIWKLIVAEVVPQERLMSYYLRKRNRAKGMYLTICESYWDDIRKKSVSRDYQTLGYVDELKNSGISDPVEYFRDFVAKMNKKRIQEAERQKMRQIGASPQRCIGYFLLKAVWQKLAPDKHLALLQSTRSFEFKVSELLQGLVYARVVKPCSKRKTLSDILPLLYEDYMFSYDQVLAGVEFIGSEYEKIIEIFTHLVAAKYILDFNKTYFDCTNYYFEIDQQDDFRRKGPSKEHRLDPIVGMGLLLDANMIPIAMKMYPGNESEQPVLRGIIRDMKRRHNLTGRTIQVADKGLNSAKNIFAALSEGDGYIFSKGIKKLSEVEQAWVLLEEGYQEVYSGNELQYKIKDCVDEFEYRIEDINGKTAKVLLKEKRVATFNLSLRRKKLIEIDRQADKAARLALSHAKRSEFGDSAKYVQFKSINKDGSKAQDSKVAAELNTKAIELDRKLAGYNLLVSSEVEMDQLEIYNVYHNLSEIEHSFRMMKSYLDARPVFLQKQSSIQGHFTICYLSLLLLRILNVFVFEQKYGMEKLTKFARDLMVVRGERSGWLNITAASDMISEIASVFDVPITSYYLKSRQLRALFNIKL